MLLLNWLLNLYWFFLFNWLRLLRLRIRLFLWGRFFRFRFRLLGRFRRFWEFRWLRLRWLKKFTGLRLTRLYLLRLLFKFNFFLFFNLFLWLFRLRGINIFRRWFWLFFRGAWGLILTGNIINYFLDFFDILLDNLEGLFDILNFLLDCLANLLDGLFWNTFLLKDWLNFFRFLFLRFN